MSWTLARVMAALSAMPLLALAVLVVLGQAAPLGSLIAALIIIFAAYAIAVIWASDLRALASLLHLAGTADAKPWPALRFLSAEILAEILQISATLSEQSTLIDRLLRAEASIVERLPDPLIVLGLDRSVRRTNAAARIAFGEDMQAVLRHPQLRAAIDRAIANGPNAAPLTADLRVPVPIPREVQAMVVALDSPLSGGPGVLTVLSDRTRERAVERMRADFVANASHELRTPLASLIGFIATLRGPAADDPPAQARFLEIMAEQAERMNRLIDDLLSLSRIEITEHQPPAEMVDLESLVERALAGFQIEIASRGVTLEWLPTAGLPAILGDTDQLEQVAQNLLDNALKYGRPRGRLRVSLSPVIPGGKFPQRAGVVLAVEDDGAGIPRQHLARLTERFYRVDTSRSRAVGGTGLGLAIVKHIVNRHRGVLLIESEPGQGTVFSVWLPSA